MKNLQEKISAVKLNKNILKEKVPLERTQTTVMSPKADVAKAPEAIQ